MPIVPLFGHRSLVDRLETATRAGTLPASLLLHGPAGAGKQRLALHLARLLLCPATDAPCGACQSCRYMGELSHPDLHWYFPRPRLKDADPDLEEVTSDLGDAIRERVASHGLYAAPSGSEGLFVASVRAMLQQASRSPAIGRRKLFIVGDADRMVAQEGADYAANAFLKLLEEPPADTSIILTSSEPGALLPTIRSRVVAVRVPPLPDAAVAEFLAHPSVQARLGSARAGSGPATELVRLAGGCPGRLLASAEEGAAAATARRLLDAAASGSRARWLRAAAGLGATKARGGFMSTLEHLTVLLHRRLQDVVAAGGERQALRLTEAVAAVERARERARGNVNPQLAGLSLLRELAAALR
ncbi:MAG: hypothetical protein ACYC2G_01635 [Gemmatimonadaceae bacterium]